VAKNKGPQPTGHKGVPTPSEGRPAGQPNESKPPQPNFNLIGNVIREGLGGNLTTPFAPKQPQHNPNLVGELIKSRDGKGKPKAT
jgi:hypothetical protein